MAEAVAYGKRPARCGNCDWPEDAESIYPARREPDGRWNHWIDGRNGPQCGASFEREDEYQEQGRGQAVISECGRYRYNLIRRWGHGGPLCIVMLNPSTADANRDDPTIRRCMGLARSNGFAAIEVVNLFAFRATDKSRIVPVGFTLALGSENDRYIESAMLRALCVVMAYGAHGGELGLWVRQRASTVSSIADRCEQRQYAFALSKGGAPRHPLYLPKTCGLIELPRSGPAAQRVKA